MMLARSGTGHRPADSTQAADLIWSMTTDNLRYEVKRAGVRIIHTLQRGPDGNSATSPRHPLAAMAGATTAGLDIWLEREHARPLAKDW